MDEDEPSIDDRVDEPEIQVAPEPIVRAACPTLDEARVNDVFDELDIPIKAVDNMVNARQDLMQTVEHDIEV